MKILVLDDENYRHDGFETILSEKHEVHHVYSVRQFRHALQSHVFEMICFDHDLADAETGADAARHLVENVRPDRWPRQCLIHSWNPSGALNIESILLGGGLVSVTRIPYGGGPR